MKLFDKVKVIQKDAPYNLYGEIGTIVRPEIEDNDGWLFFKSDNELNDKESYFLPKHLELVKSGTQQHFKDSFELKDFLIDISTDKEIEEDNFNELISNQVRKINQDILDSQVAYFKGYEITCDFDE